MPIVSLAPVRLPPTVITSCQCQTQARAHTHTHTHLLIGVIIFHRLVVLAF